MNRGTVAPHGVNQGSDGRCSNSPQATKEKEVAGTGEDTQEHAQASTMAGTSASQHRRTPRVGAASRSYLEKCRCQLEVHALGTAETPPGAVAGHRFPNLLLPDVMGCGGCGFRIPFCAATRDVAGARPMQESVINVNRAYLPAVRVCINLPD